jgi:hypothetical protein
MSPTYVSSAPPVHSPGGSMLLLYVDSFAWLPVFLAWFLLRGIFPGSSSSFGVLGPLRHIIDRHDNISVTKLEYWKGPEDIHPRPIPGPFHMWNLQEPWRFLIHSYLPWLAFHRSVPHHVASYTKSTVVALCWSFGFSQDAPPLRRRGNLAASRSAFGTHSRRVASPGSLSVKRIWNSSLLWIT